MRYIWQQVALDGRLLSDARGFFATREAALAYWKETPETARWVDEAQETLIVGSCHFHLTLIVVE